MTLAKMTRCAFALLAISLTTLLSGCIEMNKPLTNPDTASVDTNLLGAWQEDEGNKTTTYVVTTSNIPGLPAATMHATVTDYDKSTRETTSGGGLYFTVSVINGYKYINVFAKDTNFTQNQTCYLVQYGTSSDDNQLSVFLGGEVTDGALIKQNTISGRDDVQGLASYLGTSNGQNAAFPVDSKTVYQRVTSSSGSAMGPAGSVIFRPAPPAPAPVTVPPPPPVPLISLPPVQPPAPATSPVSSSSDFLTWLPWMILVFIGGIFAARKFSGRPPKP